EWIMHAEVVRETDGERLRELYDGIERVLAEVRLIVEDSESMRGHVGALIDELDRQALPIDQDELDEGKAFLRWVIDKNFTFLGYREYDFVLKDGGTGLKAL